MPVVSPSSRSSRKPKGEGHSRRGEILAAAERIFVEYGYEGATIRKIADEVGLSSSYPVVAQTLPVAALHNSGRPS